MTRLTLHMPAVVVLMLAVVIGSVTAIFSIAHAVLLRPLPRLPIPIEYSCCGGERMRVRGDRG